jgi:hypothetical protein
MRLKPSGMLRIDMPVLYGRKIVLPRFCITCGQIPTCGFR